jgi:hypothetical protein
MFLGEEDEAPWTDEDPDREMRIAVDFPLPDLLKEYAEQAARYRELVAAHDLDTKAERTNSSGRRVDLRWILLHLTEETARHNGHLDILRELVDGTTGVQPASQRFRSTTRCGGAAQRERGPAAASR